MSFFLARYIMLQPHGNLPWNTNLSTLVNAVVDRVMKDDGYDIHGDKRLQYTHLLCQRAVHLPSPARHYGSWHLFEDYFQSLLFPNQSVITTESFETVVLSAKVYIKHPDAEKLVLNRLFQRGPKSLSTFKKSKKRRDDEGKPHDAPVFGSLLEASIRSENPNLTARLMNYEVDVSREKSTVNSKGKSRKGKKYYDEYFWRLALAYQDLETLKSFLEMTTRTMTPKKLAKLLLEAVCTSQTEALQILLRHQLPQLKEGDESAYHEKRELRIQVIELCLEEAIQHGESQALSVLLQSPYAITSTYFTHRWKEYWGYIDHGPEKFNDVPAETPLETAARRGDERMVRLMLSRDWSPFGERYNERADHHGRNVYSGPSHFRGLMPMIAAAMNWHIGVGIALVEGGFRCKNWRWHFLIGTVLKSRETGGFGRDKDLRPSSTTITSEHRQAWHDRDVEFWQRLVDGGGLDLRHPDKGCSCHTKQPDMPLTHPTRSAIDIGRKFVLEELRVGVDDGSSGCDGPTGPEPIPETGAETGPLFVVAVDECPTWKS
ncbi:Putative ankyrin repeat-containing domain superfamily [Colletotrichum destructivum]|uniref:Ankyrin repeat-containing domain superfamily n=1 Tax=Colletotrichum destructivum TaxID=34406 RepID=A0AAX4IPF9_9PEZI|nr:Putative ankyrin repeat-containing domain superfamily [Colletotrichum destructivum]